MTDTEREKIKAICEIAGVSDIEDLSDGFHTFRQLYYQRMVLFATIVKQNKDRAWKSLRHEDGELCFGGGWFIVGIDTPEGSYTYHYEDNYFSLFDCKELERSKHWDGHTEIDVTRLLSLPSVESAQPTGVQDILQYLDEYLHPIVSPEHWSIYSELYDMISMLPSARPESLTDKEQRIFLAAMVREMELCKEVGRNYVREPYEDSLVSVCKEIKRKVKGALWTI